MKDQKDNPIYYPMLVPDSGTAYDGKALWGAFQQLSLQAQEILTSQEMPEVLFRIQQEFGLDDSAVMQLSRLIRWLFFERLSWEDFSLRIESLLLAAHGDASRTKELLVRIGTDVLDMRPTPYQEEIPEENEVDAQMPIVSDQIKEMPLLKALSEYPDLHNQRVTDGKIQIKSERDPVPATIRNWLRAYRDELGVGRHNTVDRGRFLFQTENTKNLTQSERERISLLVKSLDDDDPIRFHLTQKKILFPEPTVSVEKIVRPQAPVIPQASIDTPPVQITPPKPPQIIQPSVPAENTQRPQSSERLTFPGIPEAFTRISPAFSQSSPGRIQPSQSSPQATQSNPSSAIKAESLEFSSNHVLPGEQDAWDAKQ